MSLNPASPPATDYSTERPLAQAFTPWSMTRLSIAAAIYMTVAFNQSFFHALVAAHQAPPLQQALFIFSSGVMVFAVALIMISLLAFRSTFKLWLILLLLSGSMAGYFMDHYHAIINREMIQNLMQTDWEETRELLNFPFLSHFFLFGIIPAILVALIPVRQSAWLTNTGRQLGAIVLSVALFLVLVFASYQDYASVFRNNRQLRYIVAPSGYLYSLTTYAQKSLKSNNTPFEHLGEDAHKGNHWANLSDRKHVLIMVVGETARAQNFSLGDYARETNPMLSQESLFYFNNVSACGTSTAVSVPCLFSFYDRAHYDGDRIKHSDNLLDILQYAGVDVLWRDNNSGCKGVCDRVNQEDMSTNADPNLCNSHECFDMVLLKDLEARIDALTDGGIIILHQKGSHGPGYFLRSPEAFKHFTPECHSSELQQCSQTEISNAYDNTIVYTDYVLSQVIAFLKQHENRYNGAMMYVSDHGESLSEGNLYLHGIPYSIAPEEQTHIPLLLWLSNHYAEEMGIDKSCLEQQTGIEYSHDNVFDTVLDLMDVDTRIRQRERSLITPCMHAYHSGPRANDSRKA
ncbi:MAG: phosphoethanolamine--lipid A transferase [Ketobacter sp.]|nr:phosphoethanolamine--lipid A transferase [Ketobacter sp.]